MVVREKTGYEKSVHTESSLDRFKRLVSIFFRRFFDLIKAILVRLLMSLTIFLLTWRAASINGAQLPSNFGVVSVALNQNSNESSEVSVDPSGIYKLPWYAYWMPMLGIGCFLPEFLFTWFINHGHEYKWWSPAMVIFVLCSLTSIWMMELHLYSKKWEGVNKYPNATSFEQLDDIFVPQKFGEIENFDFGGVVFREYEWARILEQLFFIMIIFVKWLFPKGVMSRDQLSQLLLIYIAMATDILDILDSLMYLTIGNVYNYVIAVLVIYSLPHLQFAINYTATLGRSSRFVRLDPDMPAGKQKFIRVTCFCFRNDIWAMLLTICLQDGPFFAMRMFFIFEKHIITFANIFFTVKNGMVFIMDVYRVIAIIMDECMVSGDADDGVADSEEIRQGRFGGVYEKMRDTNDDSANDFTKNTNRAEIRLTVNAQNDVQGQAEFVLPSSSNNENATETQSIDANGGEGDDDGGERMKRKVWRRLRSRTSPLEDEEVHLFYEIDITLDKGCLLGENYHVVEAISMKDIKLRNLVKDHHNDNSRNKETSIRATTPSRRPTTRVVPTHQRLPERKASSHLATV